MIDPHPLPPSAVPAPLPPPGLAPAPHADGPAPPSAEPILCRHCGRTASNGISCEGMCVADSGY